MININLAPSEELETRYWWVPDILAFVCTFILGLAVGWFVLDRIKTEIGVAEGDITRLTQENETLKNDVDRHNSLTKEIENLQRIKDSYAQITETKLIRYLPIIVLEHLQNLKPNGLWFTNLEMQKKDDLADASARGGAGNAAAQPNRSVPSAAPADAAANPADANKAAPTKTSAKPGGKGADQTVGSREHRFVKLEGMAMNNVILGQFMTTLQATEEQQIDNADLRTQVYFAGVGLSFAKMTKFQVGNNGGEGKAEETSKDVIQFEITVPYYERQIPDEQTVVHEKKVSRHISPKIKKLEK